MCSSTTKKAKRMSDGFKDFSPCSSRRDPAKEPLCCCRWRAFTGSKNNCKTKHFCLLLEHSAITEGTKIKNISFHLVKRGTTAVLPLVPESAGCFLSSSHTEQGNSRCFWDLEAKLLLYMQRQV